MHHSKKICLLASTVLLATALNITSCGSGKKNTNSRFFTIAGQTVTDKGGPTPTLRAQLFPTYIPVSTALMGGEAGIYTFNVGFENSPLAATQPATYKFDTTSGTVNASLTLSFDQVNASLTVGVDQVKVNTCEADTGDITITAYGAVGEPVEGSFNVKTWKPTGTTLCKDHFPAPASGTFSITRIDDFVSNLHPGVDTISLTRTGAIAGFAANDTYTETATTPYDPQLQIIVDSHTTITAKTELSVDGMSLMRSISIYATGTSSGVYSLDTLDAKFSENVAGAANCSADGGTVTISKFGAPGSLVEGSFDVSNSAGDNCPTAWSGTFAVTY